jgi:hypothetical protein
MYNYSIFRRGYFQGVIQASDALRAIEEAEVIFGKSFVRYEARLVK